ncbi:hypothetical protein C7476_105308 [Phyllobacterium bourgognense]|uniref:Uncharacterized protein n=1 Tax=Phyllobacterium bourgognense TaxID=314236 RepID=A0A368YUB5_9HYPH|nr:hypothetical protein C7476_105308 [Phyllobacterium bourgognense]
MTSHAGSVRTARRAYRRNGLEKNDDILLKGPVFDVVPVESNALVIVDVIASADLPHASQAGARLEIVRCGGTVAFDFVLFTRSSFRVKSSAKLGSSVGFVASLGLQRYMPNGI